MEASWQGHIEVVKYLIDKGVKIDAKDIKGDTALILASRYGYIKVVKYLVDKGADVEAKNNEGMIALDIAKERGRSKEVIEYLERVQ